MRFNFEGCWSMLELFAETPTEMAALLNLRTVLEKEGFRSYDLEGFPDGQEDGKPPCIYLAVGLDAKTTHDEAKSAVQVLMEKYGIDLSNVDVARQFRRLVKAGLRELKASEGELNAVVSE